MNTHSNKNFNNIHLLMNTIHIMFNIIILFELFSFCLFISTAAQKWNNKFLGCFLEDNVLSLGDKTRIFLSPISPRSCSEFCSGKEYMFFILKNNKNYMSSLTKQFDSDCTIKCTGDASASCGGTPNFVSSYITDGSKSRNFLKHGGYPFPIYLGCYPETLNDNTNRLLKGPSKSFDNNTPQKCSKICFDMGYLYFGVSNRLECRCGNQKPLSSSRMNDTHCNSHCSGNNKQFCGGYWKMGIFSTGITDHIPRKYVGCFEIDENQNNGKHLTYDMGNNNSPKRCMNLCNTQQFKYAAVMGNICKCKNYEPDFNLKRSHVDCNTVCKENPSEYCGNANKKLQNLYKTLFSYSLKKVTVNHIGCFTSLKKHPILNGWEIIIPQLTPMKCINSCFARRFLYAALISSNECLCSFITPPEDAITDDSMCTTPCSGSSEVTCGGNGAINIYTTGLLWKTDAFGNYYKGCVQNNQNTKVYDDYFRNFSMNTPEFCSNHCYKLGYTYSGVTHGNECYCDNQEPNYIRSPKVNDEKCNAKCSGDANQFCGGVWSMSVFFTGLEHFKYDENLLECFKPQTNKLSDLTFSLPQNNRPSVCFKLCNDYTYPFAGVMGTSCLCGIRPPDDDRKRNNAECNKFCVGPWNELCGGENRIHVYKLKTPTSNEEHSNTYELTTFQEFDSLNLRPIWNHDVYIPQEPDYEFVFYNNSKENAFMTNGEIVIRPTVLSDDRFVREGSLILKGCTNDDDFFIYCAKNASSFNILPPIMSAKLTTKNNFFFRLGKLEVIAKLPTGDWIVSEIALISKSNEQIKFILAKSFKNTDKFQCNPNGQKQHGRNNERATVLKYGLKIDEHYHLESIIKQSFFSDQWSDDYHSFVFTWTHDDIEFKIDGISNYLDAVWNLPLNIILDSEFYVSIGVSVGGIENFRDNSILNNGHCKPWKNSDPKAMLNFWKNKDEWASTWDEEKSSLRIESIKFSTLQDISRFKTN